MRHFHSASIAFALSLASVLAAAPAAAQSQLPRPSQLPPAGGNQPQRPPAAPQAQPPAQGQTQAPAPAKPYKPVAVRPPANFNDASFVAFRKQLGDIARRKDRAALGRLVVAQGFFWLRENGDAAEKNKSGLDNLAKAVGLDGKDAPGWDMLAGYAEDPTGGPMPDRQNVICAPADPGFDEKALEQLARSTQTDLSEWGFPATAGIDVRSGPQPNAPVIEKLGMNFVRVMPEETPPSSSQQQQFLRVVTPAGKVGYVPIEAIAPLGNDQLCYVKDAGGWKIAGYIGGEPQQQ